MFPDEQDNNGGEPAGFAARLIRGESVKGGLAPLSQEGDDESELAAARFSAQGSSDSRRVAPGGSRTGPQHNQDQRIGSPALVAPSGNRSTYGV